MTLDPRKSRTASVAWCACLCLLLGVVLPIWTAYPNNGTPWDVPYHPTDFSWDVVRDFCEDVAKHRPVLKILRTHQRSGQLVLIFLLAGGTFGYVGYRRWWGRDCMAR